MAFILARARDFDEVEKLEYRKRSRGFIESFSREIRTSMDNRQHTQSNPAAWRHHENIQHTQMTESLAVAF
jgi:hypothetical protein